MKAESLKSVPGAALVWGLAIFSAQAEKIELFNGKDLSGWTSVVDHDVTGGHTAKEPTCLALPDCGLRALSRVRPTIRRSRFRALPRLRDRGWTWRGLLANGMSWRLS